MHRFFVPEENIEKDQITITGSDVNHILNVLRMKIGDKIEVFDSTQQVYQVALKEFNREFILGTIVSKLKEDTELTCDITLAMCLPKGKKMDLIVQKAVELGANSIIPVISERSIPKIEEKADKKIEHWQKIAKEAAEQSGRTKVPRIEPLIHFDELMSRKNDHDLMLLPWEGERKTRLTGILAHGLTGARAHRRTGRLLLLIGPEGGFSQNEIKLAKKSGFTTVSLGKRILRCETAAISSLALAASAWER